LQSPEEKPIFLDIAEAPEQTEPSPAKSVRPSGMVEVLKPLARGEDSAKPLERSEETTRPDTAVGGSNSSPDEHGFSWFRGLFVVVGALGIIAAIVAGGIYLEGYRPALEPAGNTAGIGPVEASVDQESESALTFPDDSAAADLDRDRETTRVFEVRSAVRPVARRTHAGQRRSATAYRRPHALFAARRPPPRRLLGSTLWVSDFVPTTLVIYIENGEIKTRIVPQLDAGYKKSTSSY
jgi:hypothetical protein